MLKEAGAAEVHVRISSPPITWPCFYGIDFASRAELIASGIGVEQVRQSIGADSLGFLSREGMVAATGQPANQLCTACFTGEYPIELPAAEALGKNLLERGVAKIQAEGHLHPAAGKAGSTDKADAESSKA
jgi:amidophosphoribosyltransferase